eukprot:5285675-Pyramimonas_sp.AAC.1
MHMRIERQKRRKRRAMLSRMEGRLESSATCAVTMHSPGGAKREECSTEKNSAAAAAAAPSTKRDAAAKNAMCTTAKLTYGTSAARIGNRESARLTMSQLKASGIQMIHSPR